VRRRVGCLGVCLAIGLGLWLPAPAWAGFTECAPAGTFVVDESLILSWVHGAFGDEGERKALVEERELYEPGGPLQGVLTPDPRVQQALLITQILYGVTDWLTVGVGIPVVLRSHVDVRLGWQEGAYQSRLGRAYSEDDFWSWAESMGQKKPGNFDGNRRVLSDLVLAARWRFSDHIPWARAHGLSLALFVTGALPTGHAPDPDEVVSVGTTLWDLMAQGDLGVHLGADQAVPGTDRRLQVGLDLFAELFFPRTRRAPTGGEDNPLLLNHAPFVGETYTIQPGHWFGGALQASVVAWRGPALGTWLTGGDATKAMAFPPLLGLTLGYRFVGMLQSDWRSHAPHWDWDREEPRRPGYRSFLSARLSVSLLRVGAPLQVYAAYANGYWIPGRNTIAQETLSIGIQVPLQFW